MKKATVFGFIAKLQKKDSKNYFIVPFKVAAANHDDAKANLVEYLNRPEQTGFNYDKCLEIIDSSADIILVNDNFVY